jgi:hypothetical protein
MFLKEFNTTPATKVAKINKVLQEQFGITVKTNFPSRKKLEKVLENTNMALVKLRGTNKKFQLDPDYAKFLGIKDVIETMIAEGMYAKSAMHEAMCEMIKETVRSLMDSGYTMDEAVGECMNRYRMDNRFAYDDEYVLPVVITAAKSYMDECNMGEALAGGNMGATVGNTITGMPGHNQLTSKNVAEQVLRALAKEAGVELTNTSSYKAIEEKLNSFAEVSGKSRDAVVEFLNSLDEAALLAGIQMFGRKIGEANKFVDARRKAIAAGDKEFEVDGKTYKVTGDTKQEKMNEAESKERPYVCVHAKKGKHECTASSSYEAAKKAAAKWGLKSTAGIDAHLADVKHTPTESMFDDIINDLLNEEVDVEQAEVVMAVRALSDDVQDQIERIGRMMNEDVPAIADKMRGEMGAQAAQSFTDSVNGLLATHLEATKGVKAGLDSAVGSMTGEEMVGGLGDTGELGGGLAEPDMPEEEPEMDINEPAAAGPEEEPLGRAEV